MSPVLPSGGFLTLWVSGSSVLGQPAAQRAQAGTVVIGGGAYLPSSYLWVGFRRPRVRILVVRAPGWACPTPEATSPVPRGFGGVHASPDLSLPSGLRCSQGGSRGLG